MILICEIIVNQIRPGKNWLTVLGLDSRKQGFFKQIFLHQNRKI